MNDKNYRTLYEEALKQQAVTEDALYLMAEKLAKEKRTGGLCNICGGSGVLLTEEPCSICSGTGYGYKETEGLRSLVITYERIINRMTSEREEILKVIVELQQQTEEFRKALGML